jgi:hypothetical protein
VSLERADSVRGGSYDYYEIDEAALLKEVDFKQVLLPALRGNRDKFDCISHQQVSFYTSIPWKPSGYWILNFEKKKQLQPKKYAFVEATAFDNIHILGKDGIERLREELDHLEFEVEVMNRRIKKGKFAFYDKFDPDRHTYTPRLRKGSYELYDDYDPNAYLNLSLDFGGHINFGTVWQQHGNVERCVGEFFKKGSNSLKPLIQAFCKRFEENECKQVKIWGEPRGHDAQPGSDSWFDLTKQYFIDEGWNCIVEAPSGYRTNKHETRQEVMNAVFEGGRKDLPIVSFNDAECTNTILVLQTTEVDSEGKKVKTAEKNPNFPQEQAPHAGDTVDYYIYMKYVVKKHRKKKGSRKVEAMETV